MRLVSRFVLFGWIALAAACTTVGPGAGVQKALPGPRDCSQGPIPATPAAGTISGMPFKPVAARLFRSGSATSGGVKLDAYHLDVVSEGDSPRMEAGIGFLVPSGQLPDGRTLRATPSSIDQPNAAEGMPEIQGWSLEDHEADLRISSGNTESSEGSVRVEFGARSGNSIPVKIHVCVSAREAGEWGAARKASELAGTVAAKL